MSASQNVSSEGKLALEELVAATGGRVLSQFSRAFTGVGTDTRVDLSGKIFIALKGDQFDAHDFLAKAVAAGAQALLIHKGLEDFSTEEKKILDQVTVVQVADTLLALQALGHFWRRKMPARILGLTGTNGKTTTKEFAAALIGAYKKVQYSKGSLNNHWGVPLSLLSIAPEHEFAIIEAGMNHPGELTVLAKIAEPDVTLVTMVGRGHLQGLGTVEGVAQAKSEFYAASPAAANMIFNLENVHTARMFDRYGRGRLHGAKAGEYLTFAGMDWARANRASVDVSLQVEEMELDHMTVSGWIAGVEGRCRIPVFGTQNVTNLMAASALALAAGLTPQEIWAALPNCRTVWGRNQWVQLKSGARALFDGYNANPESMAAAIENFAKLKVAGRKFAILGEMREMGEHASAVHRELGERASRCDFSAVCFFGPSGDHFQAGLQVGGFQKTSFISSAYEQSLAPKMLPVLQVGDIVLIKGSRGMALEKALAGLDPLDFGSKS